MNHKDCQKLIALAKIERNSASSKADALARLISAGILDKSGNFTKHYPFLAAFAKQH